MVKCIGISKQSFLIMGTYMCLILFHSTSLLSAAAAIAAVLLVQAGAYLVMPFLAERADARILPYAGVLFTAATGTLIYRLYALIPLNGIMTSSMPFPGSTYLLILLPLLIDQANNPVEYKVMSSLRYAGIFSGMMISVSFFRELLGFGTLLGIQVIPQGSQPLLLLTHSSGAAFLLLLLTVLAIFIYRQITGKHQVLAVLDGNGKSGRQPVLDRIEERDHLQMALISLLFIVPVMLSVYFMSVYIFPSGFEFDLLVLAAIMLQGVTAAALFIFADKSSDKIQRILENPWLIPAQTVVIALPYSIGFVGYENEHGFLSGLFGMLLYLVCLWIFVGGILLFQRAVKRKLLFGNRPDILSGLPLMLLIAALGLLILAGFGTIPYAQLPG